MEICAETTTTSSSTATDTSSSPLFPDDSLREGPPDLESFSAAYRTVGEEVACRPIEASFSNVPKDLCGTLYVSVPAMFTSGSLPPPKGSGGMRPQAPVVPDGADPSRMATHPYDADGMLLGITLSPPPPPIDDEDDENNNSDTGTPMPPSAVLRARYVRTNAFTSERKRGKRFYSAMDAGRTAPSKVSQAHDHPLPLYKHHLAPGLNKKRSNRGHGVPLYWAKRLLVPWEGGLPYKMDLLALSTIGKSALGGVLGAEDPMGGKHAMDAARERLVVYSNKLGESDKFTVCSFLEFDAEFKEVDEDRRRTLTLDGVALVSDVSVTEEFIVVAVPKTKVTENMRFLIGERDPSKILALGEGGTIYLIPRTNREATPIAIPLSSDGLGTEADLQIMNAYQPTSDPNLVQLDVIRSSGTTAISTKKPALWPWATDLDQYRSLSTRRSLWRYTIDVRDRTVVRREYGGAEDVADGPHIGFGTINPHCSAREHRYIYATMGGCGKEVAPPQGIVKYDCMAGSVIQQWKPSVDEYCGEPIYAPYCRKEGNDVTKDFKSDEDDGYLLTLLYSGKLDTSSLLIFNANEISGGPICTVPLGMRIPHGGRGTYVSGLSWSKEEIERRARLAEKIEAKGARWNEVKSDFSGLGLRLDDFEDIFGTML